jgi:hypothetical protein
MGIVNDPRPPLTTTTSIWPAATVLIVAVATLTIFLLLNLLTSQRTVTSGNPAVVVGSLQADRANHGFGGCLNSATTPSNIASTVVLPATTSAVQLPLIVNQGAGDYDCLATFTTAARQSDVLGFYEAQLEARGWHLYSSSNAVGGTHGAQLLFQQNGADTFLWIFGLTVQRHTVTTTTYQLRLYQGNNGV